MRIFLDLDEVLADFVGGACEAWGTTLEEVLPHWPLGKWDCIEPIGKSIGATALTPNVFWRHIEGIGERFWAELKHLPQGSETLREVKKLTTDWWILSSPSKCPSSYSGKVKWLRKYFGDDFNRFAITQHKHLLAKSDTVLIDDSDSNVVEFRRAGGAGIIYPAYHNSLHARRDDPAKYVKEELNFWRECRCI